MGKLQNSSRTRKILSAITNFSFTPKKTIFLSLFSPVPLECGQFLSSSKFSLDLAENSDKLLDILNFICEEIGGLICSG